eukprot:Rhum_TRINITY_DN13808_c0_g2::Rhum_TRINITY_DN13808_c0_g2_i1::g.64617::m.64617
MSPVHERRSVGVPAPNAEATDRRPAALETSEAPFVVDSAEAASLTAGKLYENCSTAESGYEWFSLFDCFTRYAFTVLLHYWALVTSPVSYTIYTFKHNMLWYGTIPGILLSLFLPIMPVGYVIVQMWSYVKNYFEADWTMSGPGRVFFIKPKHPVAALLWDLYLKQSMYVGQYYLVGTNAAAIQHTWQDTILVKDYWRDALNSVHGRLPRELGRWSGTELTMAYSLDKCDVVVKIPDSYLGIGDSFWNHGQDYSNVDELRALLEKNYKGKEAMVLEMVRPKKSLGVHSFDIVTLRNPNNEVKVLSCLLWTDCTTDSSHSCRAGYIIDVDTETITAPAGWYSPFFAKMDAPLIGTKVPGIKDACETAVAAHQGVKEQWLTAVGWDAMIMEDQVVFFEGNFAGARTPRRMFLSWRCLTEFIWNYAWPFTTGRTLLAHTVPGTPRSPRYSKKAKASAFAEDKKKQA